jgi:hypothetical protein
MHPIKNLIITAAGVLPSAGVQLRSSGKKATVAGRHSRQVRQLTGAGLAPPIIHTHGGLTTLSPHTSPARWSPTQIFMPPLKKLLS